MVVYSKAALPGKPFLQFNEIVSCEINNLPTAGANKVMVVLRCTDCIAWAAIAGVELADESKVGQYVEGAVDCNQPDVGVSLAYPVVNRCWGEVVVAGGDSVNDAPALWSKLVTVATQSPGDAPLGRSHLIK